MRDIIVENGKLAISGGDFKIAESDSQHLEHLLTSKQGEWKQTPLLGCNIVQSQNGTIDRLMRRNIAVQLEMDGFKLESLILNKKGIEINGKY